MTRDEHLMTIAMEECAEVAQRVSKALRFGMEEIQPGQPLTNAERIRQEYSDLAATLEMLGIGAPLGRWMDEKRAKVTQFLEYSAQCGTLTDSPRDGAPAPVHTAEHLDELLELLWEMRREREGSVNAFYQRADQAFKLADELAAALPHAPQAPDDWEEFVVSAFNEGWAAATSGEFQTLAEAYDESHVKLQFGILHERAAHAPRPPTGWQPIETARRVEMLPVFLRINGRGKVGYWHDGKWRSGGPDPVTEPSHWMPIPDYPPLPAPVAPHEEQK